MFNSTYLSYHIYFVLSEFELHMVFQSQEISIKGLTLYIQSGIHSNLIYHEEINSIHIYIYIQLSL